MTGSVATPPSIRFERHYVKDGKCWRWTGGLFDSGYGKFNGGKGDDGRRRTVYAHRFSYAMHVGDIPEGMFVLHSCDNPRCVNPAHLSLGTQLDNIADMFAKGRAKPGGRKCGPQSHSRAQSRKGIR